MICLVFIWYFPKLYPKWFRRVRLFLQRLVSRKRVFVPLNWTTYIEIRCLQVRFSFFSPKMTILPPINPEFHEFSWNSRRKWIYYLDLIGFIFFLLSWEMFSFLFKNHHGFFVFSIQFLHIFSSFFIFFSLLFYLTFQFINVILKGLISYD